MSRKQLAKKASKLVESTDAVHALTVPNVAEAFVRETFAPVAVALEAESFRKVGAFVEGFLCKAKAEFKNTEFANRAILAAVWVKA